MALTTGTRLASYEVVAAIGAGGMGEVYRGRDTKLGRSVAVKVLPDAGAGGADRIAPFAPEAGLILGTAAYMSPEQAKGFPADHRSDVFSFGVVLYEMLTGRQPFQGETAPDVLASVLAREPELTRLPSDLNPRMTDLVRR